MSDHSAAPPTDRLAVTLFDDRAGASERVDVTPALATLFGYAHRWSLQESRTDGCTLSFSSMLAAMVAGPDPLCEWLRRHLALRGVLAESVTKGRTAPRAPLPEAPLATTHSFRQARAEAERLADGRPLDVRHFMAAYVIVRDYHREDFLRLRIDRRAWCLELADVLKVRFPDEAERWERYAARAPAVLLPGFDADQPRGADLLSVGREVEAFAMLVAGRDTLTPLSVGVFGAWGSGKSYFMARLEERVAALAASGPRTTYRARIAQVRFNAWHYSESNVVASLVATIFRNLRFDAREDDAVLAARRDQALRELGVAEDVQRQREESLREARAAEDALRTALDEVGRASDSAMRDREAALDSARAALADAEQRLARGIAARDDALASVERTAPVREAVALATQTLLEDATFRQLDDDMRRVAAEARWVGLNTGNILLGLVALAITTLVVLFTPMLRDTKLVAGMVGVAAAVTPVVASWARTLRRLAATGAEYRRRMQARTDAATRAIEAAAAQERQALEQELQRRAADVERLAASVREQEARAEAVARELAAKQAARQQAGAELASAATRVAEKRQRLASITAGSFLAELVGELSSTGVYERELSALARVRSDFERLSSRMAAAAKEFEDGTSPDEPVLERIVLYVDDLDRCPEETVRQVLRAVHLLLAFDLFVCVVAVDPRWVIQCLRESPGVVAAVAASDSDLDALGGAATPSDYLEKIFQVPLWLRPVPAAQRAAVVGTLLARHLVDGDAAPMVPVARIRVAGGDDGDTRARAAPAPRSNGPAVPPDRPAAAPQRIAIDARELAFLPRVAPLLDGNPRALKRFVNTYRLVKASLSDVELEYYVRGAPYRVCMAQLAVLATQRQRARVLVRLTDATQRAARGASDESVLRLGAWLADAVERESETARSVVADLRAALLPELDTLPFEHFALWLERTRRYSFYL